MAKSVYVKRPKFELYTEDGKLTILDHKIDVREALSSGKYFIENPTVKPTKEQLEVKAAEEKKMAEKLKKEMEIKKVIAKAEDDIKKATDK